MNARRALTYAMERIVVIRHCCEMPRYHLNLHNAHIDATDEEGVDLADMSEAHVRALAGIRDFIGHEACSGKIDLRGRVDIADDKGTILATVAFKDAFQIDGI